jgi:hypothetical protein
MCLASRPGIKIKYFCIGRLKSFMLKNKLRKASEAIGCFSMTLMSLLLVLLFSKRTSLRWIDSQHDSALVFGNGPSLSKDLPTILARGLQKKMDVWAVNNFCFSSEFTIVKPKFYVLADPNYWLPAVSSSVDLNRREFIATINKMVDWEMKLLLPCEARSSNFVKEINLRRVKVCFYNKTPVKGNRRIVRLLWSKGFGMPAAYNVLVATLSLAALGKYTKIYVFGADHSWHEDLTVSSDGTANLNQRHFYDEKTKAVPVYRPDNTNFSIGDLFIRWGKVFKQYEIIQEYAIGRDCTILNSSAVTYIDAFPRCSVEDLEL